VSIESRIDIVVKNLNQLNKLAANLQNINKTNEQLVKGLDKVQTGLDKIGTKGFKNLNREANQALKTVQKLSLGLAKLYRPGRATERRGLLLGGLGAAGGLGMLSSTGAGKAIGGAMGAGSAKAAGFMSMIPGLKGAGAALTATTAKIAGVSKGLAGLGALMAAQPQLLGVAMAAWLAFGNKGLFNAAKQAEKTTVKLFGLENTLKNLKKSTGIFGARPLVDLGGLSYELNISSDAARKLELSVNGAAKALTRIRNNRKIIEGSGFAEFSKNVRGAGYNRVSSRSAKELAINKRKNDLFIQQANNYERLVSVGGEMLNIEERIELVQKRRLENLQKNDPNQRKLNNQRFRENLMLGAGFPMLFGGGVGSVGGGIAGAVAQRAMGTSGGFGAQILLSALGQQLDTFVGEVAQLGKAFNKINPDVNAVIASLGETNTAYGKHLEMLKKIKGDAAALVETERAVASIIGEAGLGKLKEFGQDATNLGNAWQKVILRMQASIASLITRTGILKALSQSMEKGTAFQKANLAIITGTASPELQKLWAAYERQSTAMGSLENIRRNAITRPLNEDGSFKFPSQRELRPMIADQFLKDQKNLQTGNLLGSGADKLALLDEEIKHLERSLEIGTKRAGIEQEIAEFYKAQGKNVEEIAPKEIANLQTKFEQRDALKEQLEMWAQIKDVIAGGLTNAITGLIEGTKTLGEALSGILKQIGQILIQKALTSWIGGLNFGSGGVASGGTGAMVARDNAMYGNTFPAGSFSTGGMVTRPTVGLVGEAGEDEYIIPASKMAASMQRYSAGARGESVIPGTGSSYSGGGAGGSTTVNYSGPILHFNSEEFVPKSAVGQIIATATSQGAKAGENRTLSTLRNSRSARSRLGM